MSNDRKSGGCQCGALRFETTAPFDEAYICHCRMCQKSVGGPFAVYVKLPRSAFRWTRGQPAEWASSTLGFRQFCGTCGTPVGYRYRVGADAANQYLTGGGFDDFQSIVPTVQFASESRLHWMDHVNELSERDLGDDVPGSFFATLTSYQHPDRDVADWSPPTRSPSHG
jgi:hypothetical protein